MVTDGGNLNDIYYAVRDTDGRVIKPITPFTSDIPDRYEGYGYPNLAQLSGNRVLLVWYRGSDGNIYYAVLDSAGNIVKAETSTGGAWGWYPDAVQLSNGNIVIAWSGSICFVVLDSAYNLIAGPTALSNPAAVTGDDYVSVAADSAGHAILTWTDSDWDYRRNLYYALVDGNGNMLTGPMIFRTSQATDPYIETSYKGYGNTSYIVAEPACRLDLDCDGDVDVDDIMQVASRWRMTEGDPNWDARYDLNDDGIITVVDIMLVVAHWGERCD